MKPLFKNNNFTFRDPVNDQVFRLVDQRVDLNVYLYPSGIRTKSSLKNVPARRTEELTPLRISQVIDSCHQNKTIYNVIRLDTFYDIETLRDLPKQYGIQDQLDRLIDSIQLKPNLEIWSDAAQKEFDRLASSKLTNFDLDKTLDNVSVFVFNYFLLVFKLF